METQLWEDLVSLISGENGEVMDARENPSGSGVRVGAVLWVRAYPPKPHQPEWIVSDFYCHEGGEMGLERGDYFDADLLREARSEFESRVVR